jgi:ribosome maturation factor RimP
VVEELALELVDIEYQREGQGWVLRIYLDKDGGITLDDCAAASREFSPLLDVEDVVGTAYNLEVSSPGLERPLKKLSDFQRFKGRSAKIKTRLSCDPDQRGHKRKTFAGELLGVEDQKICLLQSDKIGGKVCFALEELDKAHLVFEF